MPLLNEPIYSFAKLSVIIRTILGLEEGLFVYFFMGLKFEITTSFGILKSVFLNELTPNVLKKVKAEFKTISAC